MKSWKKSIISMAVALCLLASFIPAPANIAAAAVGDTITYDFTTVGTGSTKKDMVNFDTSSTSKYTGGAWKTMGEGLIKGTTLFPSDATKVNSQSCGLQVQVGDSKGWFTIRINVPEAGWYVPTFEAWGVKNGGDFSVYFSDVVDNAAGTAETVNTLKVKAETYLADENFMCVVNNYGKSGTSNYAVSVDSVTMRAVNFKEAGWYAFTVKGDTIATLTPRYLKLKKVAETTAAANTVTPDLKIDDMFANVAKTLALGSRVSADAVQYNRVVDIESTRDEAAGTGKTATYKSTYYSLAGANVSFNGSVGVTGKISEDKKTITVIASMVVENAYLNVTVERDGATWTEQIPFSVSDTETVEHTLTYNFAKDKNPNPIAGDTAEQDCRIYNSEDDPNYTENGQWSLNDEHGSFAQKTTDSNPNNKFYTNIRFAGAKYGIQMQTSDVGQWVMMRIKVDSSGWYTPTMSVWMKSNGGIFSAYLAPVSKAPGVITETELEALRAEKYCIGQTSCDNGLDSAKAKRSVKMRTVYLEAGEYAFTVKADSRDSLSAAGSTTGNGTAIYPSSLVLDRVAREKIAINADIFSGGYAYLVGKADGTYDMHLFGGINTLDGFETVGFKVGKGLNSDYAEVSSDKVYNSIKVNYNDGTSATISAKDLGMSSGHLFHRVIENIDVSADEGYYVTAYAVDEDGNTVYGYSTAISVKAKA